MAHYCFIEEETMLVTQVIVGRDEDDLVDGVTDWESYYGNYKQSLCKRTSYNTFGGVHYTDGFPSDDQSKAFRFNYAGIGYRYDEALDAFIPPKPYESWELETETCLWIAPIPMPEDGFSYYWDEDSGDWVQVVEEPAG